MEILNYNTCPENLSNFTACYNGNISAMQWSISNENIGYNRTYVFIYDELDRLLSSIYGGYNGGITSAVSGKNSEFYGYDNMGNLTFLVRNENGTSLNSLTMSYTGNQLKTVNDKAGTAKPYGGSICG